MTAVDRSDMQGLLAFGYGKLTNACYLIVRIQNPDAARRWLAATEIATAEVKPAAPDTAVQVAFTAEGLLAMGAPQQLVDGFSPEFCAGMSSDPSRSRRLGDVASNDPATWMWGGPESVPHILVGLFSKEPLAGLKSKVQNELWDQAFASVTCLTTSDMGGVEPFGFKDGISQPELDWDAARDATRDQVTYSEKVALGEFVLGYRNEYGKYTDRPLLDARLDPANELLPAEENPARKDFGRNGTFLIFRHLEQSVPAFWQYVDRVAAANRLQRDSVAASLVGRKRNGDPLIPGTADDPQNGFNYDEDDRGLQCPLGAHVRRANPRNADFPPGTSGVIARMRVRLGVPAAKFREDLVASTRFHRVLRRGREYGSRLSPEQALSAEEAAAAPSGIHFICLNANIARQFEFVQGAWMMSGKFDGLADESDPILGNAAGLPGCPASRQFSIPAENSISYRLADLPQFVRVRGGAYFFLPGIRALKFLIGTPDSMTASQERV